MTIDIKFLKDIYKEKYALFITFFHIFMVATATMFILISTNVKVLFILLIFMIGLKFCFYIFKRCILTYLESDKYFLTSTQMFSYAITERKLDDKTIEKICINTGIAIVCVKLIGVITIKQFYEYIPMIIKIML